MNIEKINKRLSLLEEKVFGLLPVECDACPKIAAYKKPTAKNESLINWAEGAHQCGMSKKRPGKIAIWCSEHFN